MKSVLYAGHNFLTDKIVEPDVRILIANKVAHSKTESISRRIIHPFWVLSCTLNRGGYYRCSTVDAPWIPSEPGIVGLRAPEIPYWQDFRSLKHQVHSAYVAFTVNDTSENGFFRSLLNHVTFFQDPNKQITDSILELIKTVGELGEHSFFTAQSSLYAIIASLQLASPTNQANETRFFSFDKELDAYLKNQLSNNITVNEVADKFNISVPSLFKKCRGNPPIKRMLKIRLETAKSKLIQGEPVKSIIQETGFWDESHFSNAFKKYTGFSPRDYLKQYC